MSDTVPVVLKKCAAYHSVDFNRLVMDMLDEAGISVKYGARILVKPNLLMKRPLACTSPQVTVAVCKWLMDQGASIRIGDSPGFGSAESVARETGLEEELRPLGLKVEPLRGRERRQFCVDGKKVVLTLSQIALEQDCIFSVCRVKAHSQLRLTLSVKNCFGCIPGLYKAIVHARYGDTTEFFAQCIAELFKSLPRVHGVADGVVAMHVTGPAKGEAFPLHLLGACVDPLLLDLAIIRTLRRSPEDIPLAKVFSAASGMEEGEWYFPDQKPEDFYVEGFMLPEKLKAASFNPGRLFKSCLKRIWSTYKI